jgi:hypothetical protein
MQPGWSSGALSKIIRAVLPPQSPAAIVAGAPICAEARLEAADGAETISVGFPSAA